MKITRDLTERHKTDEELTSAKLKFDLLMTGVQEYAIFLMDPEGRVTDWNSAAERLLGYKQDEAIGLHFSAFWTAEEGLPGTGPIRSSARRSPSAARATTGGTSARTAPTSGPTA